MQTKDKVASGIAPKTSCLRSFLGSSSRPYEDATCLKASTARVASSQDFDDYYASKYMTDDEKKTKRSGNRFRIFKCLTEVPSNELDDVTLHSKHILLSKGQRKKSRSHDIGKSQLNEYKAPEILKIHADVQSNNTVCTMNTTITEEESIKNRNMPEGSRFNVANQHTSTTPQDVNFNTNKDEHFFSCSFTNFSDLEQSQRGDNFPKISVKPLSDKSSQKKYHTPTRPRETHHLSSKNESTIQNKTTRNSLSGYDSPAQSKKSMTSFPRYNSPTISRRSTNSLPRFDSPEKKQANPSFPRHRSSATTQHNNNSFSKNDSSMTKRNSSKSIPKQSSPSQSRKTTYSEKKTSKFQNKNIHKAIHHNLTRQRSSSNISAARSQSHSSFGELTTAEEEEFLDSLANVLTANDKSQSLYDDLLSDIDQITGKTKKEREKERSVEMPNFIGLEIHAHSDHKLEDDIVDDLDDAMSLSSISLQKPHTTTPPADGGSKIGKKTKKKSRSSNDINEHFARASSSLLEKYIPDKQYETFNFENNEGHTKKSSKVHINHKKVKDNFKHRHSTEKDSFHSSEQSLNYRKMTVEDKREKQEKLNRLRNGNFDAGNSIPSKQSEKRGNRALRKVSKPPPPPPPPPPISNFGDEDELPPLLFPEEHLPFDESPEKSFRRASHYSSSNEI